LVAAGGITFSVGLRVENRVANGTEEAKNGQKQGNNAVGCAGARL
jgi:hypothetical protein